MNTPLALITVGACVMYLTACDKTSVPLPTPQLEPPQLNAPGAPNAAIADPPVPPADSVLAPTNDPELGKTDGTRKPKQESETTLLPGQNNDHSAPLSPAR